MARRRRTPAQKYSNFNISATYNEVTYNNYYVYMTNIYMSRIVLQGLPVQIDPRFVNRMLMMRPGIAFFYDEVVEQLAALPFNAFNTPDIYGNPTMITVYSMNGQYERTLKRSEFEIVWANYNRAPAYTMIELYAERMAQIQLTTDVNIHNQKTPKLVKTNANTRLSTKNVLKEIDGYVPVIEVDEAFNTEELTALDISTPYLTDKLDIHKNMVWNEYLTWCGIENGNMDKKERMIAAEAMANYGNVEMARQMVLLPLEEGFRRVNTHFGTKIEPEFNSHIATLINQTIEEMREMEGVVNG